MVRSTDPLSLETIIRIAHDLQKQGKRIGFTHGAFDLFHYGHLHLLRESAKKCDFLIVGVESDKNIGKYKHYSRPIIDERRRFEIVNELDCVNAAFVSNEEVGKNMYIDLGRELKVDVLTAGARYGAEDKIRYEADRMRAKLVRILDTFESTTKIVDRIVAKHAKRYPGMNKITRRGKNDHRRDCSE